MRWALALVAVQQLSAFEDSQILPQGVRRLQLNSFHQSFDQQKTSTGGTVDLANRLERNVRYQDFINQREGFAKAELEAFLLSEGIDPKQAVGSMQADIKARVDVFAPSFSLGISRRWSLGVIVPIVRAATDAKISFRANSEANRFLGRLTAPEVGLRGKAQEAVDAINGAAGSFQNKLLANGYSDIGAWSTTGLGDVMVKAKYQALDASLMRIATTIGFAAPTGRVDDPDILTDLPFGDGTWDIISLLSFDEKLGSGWILNQYAGYTWQLPAEKTVRLRTEEEPIAVDKKKVRYDMGDKFDAGLSLQFDTESGWIGGTGYAYQTKTKDRYRAGESRSLLEEATQQESHMWENSIGYSGVKAYLRDKRGIPYTASFGYTRMLSGRNVPSADRAQFETKIFF